MQLCDLPSLLRGHSLADFHCSKKLGSCKEKNLRRKICSKPGSAFTSDGVHSGIFCNCFFESAPIAVSGRNTASEESGAAAAGQHECSPVKRDWPLSLRHHQFSWKLGHPFRSLQTWLTSCAQDVLAPRLKLVSKAKQSLGSTTAGPDGT